MFELFEAAGNRFVLIDVRDGGAPPRMTALARELCQPAALREGWQADGLLLLTGSEAGATGRMRIFNADGSLAKACGNGLRCVAWHLMRTEGLVECSVETDSGLRRTRLVERDGAAARLSTELGVACARELSSPLPAPFAALPAQGVDVGNPHCVLEVSDERVVDLARLARVVREHADFPQGVNVGVVAWREERWWLRVNERGVGETEACGTGACAAATALARHARASFPLTLQLPGGPLTVAVAPRDGLALEGPVRALGHAALAHER